MPETTSSTYNLLNSQYTVTNETIDNNLSIDNKHLVNSQNDNVNITKRSLSNDTTNLQHYTELPLDLVDCCYELTKCACNPTYLCSLPSTENCNGPNKSFVAKFQHPQPGDCCPKYNCIDTPDCSLPLMNHVEWLEPCLSCICINGIKKCNNTCTGTSVSEWNENNNEIKTCYSSSVGRYYNHGEKWNEDDGCTYCECVNGEPNCHAMLCKPLNCEVKIKRPGECCQVCDTNGSNYCEGEENCPIRCRQGYQMDEIRNCERCKCAVVEYTSSKPTVTSVTSFDGPKDQQPPTKEESTTTQTIALLSLFAILVIFVVGGGIYYYKKKHQHGIFKPPIYTPVSTLNDATNNNVTRPNVPTTDDDTGLYKTKSQMNGN